MRTAISYRLSVIGWAVVVVSSFILPHSSFGQGALTPPAAPAPTFKTLQQVEPRTPITNLPVTISVPGSYYFITNLTGAAGDGIHINVGDVTLDLNGFALIGGTGAGILLPNPVSNVRIRNGTVRGWGGAGISAGNGSNCRFEALLSSGNGGDGIRGGARTLILGCVAQANGAVGLASGSDSVMRDCTATGNTNGIVVTGVITGCTANDNAARGISLGSSTVASDCGAFNNGTEGIFCNGSGSVIRNCSAVFNTGDGIHAFADIVILANMCDSNGQGAGTGAGIHIMTGGAGTGSRIEGNNVTDNDTGIDVDNAGHLIIKNSAQGNTTDYSIAAGNRVGEILVVTNAATVTITNCNPWANFRY
jgi:hypothetical protein